MTGAATPIESTFSARARDMFLLKGAERAVRSFTPEQHAAVRKHFDAAQRRASVADDLSDDRNAAVAYVLYREAVTLLISAVQASRHPERALENLDASKGFDSLQAMAQEGSIPQLPPFVTEACKVLAESDPLAFDRSPTEDLLARRKSVEHTIRWLSDLVEPRTLTEIRASRILRLSMMGVVICAFLAWGVFRITRPVNLALGKPVTASSRHPQTAAPLDNSGVTNGEIESAYGVATAPPAGGSPAWVMVDLLQPTHFKRIKIFNRADGWFDDPLPMKLELSDDATTFNVVDTRTTSFSARLQPWVYEPPTGGTARYIRISSATNLVAINEVEVNP